MDDNGQRSLQKEQWLPVFDKGEKRASSLGSGAFRFIRTRSSIRRELKRQCNRSKNESSMSPEVPASSGVGGLGKWLRDHLGGGSKSHQDSSPTLKSHGTLVEGPINEKPFGRAIYASQNLYCSLPREHNRHGYNVSRKTSHGNSVKSQGHDRQRSNSVNNHNHHHHYHHHEKANLAELGSLTRGGPIYGSEGKSLKKRNRDRRRHSLNESHDLAGRQRRRRIDEEIYNIDEEEEFEDEDESEEEGPEELKERQGSIDDLDDWYVPSYHSLEGEKYKQSFDEGEEEEAEEEIPLSPAYSEEKFVAEERQVEYDHVFDQLHPEADGDREVVIDKLRELHSELADLKRRNKLLEVWVLRCLKKNQQQITRTDPTKSYEDLEAMYKEELRVYKMQVDDIQSQQNELMFELQNYIDKVQSIGADTDTAFRELLDREKDVAVDLVFEKTGKKVTEKMMNALTRRQIARSKVLAQGRQKFIYLKHRLEELQARLKSVETLGEGMTTMDYEAFHVANIGYKDKLDEREQELESLRIKIAQTVNGVAQYKEKEICLAEDIVFEEERLKARRSRTTKFRGRVNNARVKLKQLRDEFNEKKNDAGLLVALPELMEMERRMSLRDNLKKSINAFEREIKQYKQYKHKPLAAMSKAELITTLTLSHR